MKKRMSLRIALAALLGVGLYAFAAPAPTAHAAPPTSHTTFRTFGSSAFASFSFVRGDITGNAFVQVSPEGFQFSPMESFPGPAVQISITECNNVTNECFFGGNMTQAPGVLVDAKKLTSATLPEITVPVMSESGAIVSSVTMALTWTGVGDISSQSGVYHTHSPRGFSEMYHYKGISRDATVSGVVSYTSPFLGSTITITGDDLEWANLISSGYTYSTFQR